MELVIKVIIQLITFPTCNTINSNMGSTAIPPSSGKPELLITLVVILEMHSTPLASRHENDHYIYQASSPKSGTGFFPLRTYSPCLRTCHPHLTRLVPQFLSKGGEQLSVSCIWVETEMNGCGFAADECLA